MGELCWFKATLGDSIGPCDGRLVKCHLISRQLLRKEFPHGAAITMTGQIERAPRVWPDEPGCFAGWRPLEDLIADDRTWVPGCSGITGLGGHHAQLDHSRTLRIPRHLLPEYVEEFAQEYGLTWWVEREYGPLKNAA